MKRIIRVYQRIALISFLTFCIVWNFVFGIFFSFDRTEVKAAAVTWVGADTGTWETGSNWSSGLQPSVSDDVTISSSTANIVITLSSGELANFSSLTIGGDPTYSAELILIGNIGVGTDIVVAENGILRQQNNIQQTISNTISIESGGVLTHATNTTAHDYSVYFSVNNIDVQSGGSIYVDEKGYGGSIGWGSPRGPGAGKWNSGGSYGRGTGAGHGGYGGKAVDTANAFMGSEGGTPYCDITNPTTPGSEGSLGTNDENGGDGGGVIRIIASGIATLSGTVSANGGNGSGSTVYTTGSHGGGGSAGTINIQADTIAGSPEQISSVGGNGGNNGSLEGAGGGGSGGCVYLEYATTNSLSGTSVQFAGGEGGQRGASGLFYLKQTGQAGDLFVVGNGKNVHDIAETPQNVSTLSLSSIRVASSSIYVVTSTRSLALSSETPISGLGSAPTGTLKIDYGTVTVPTASTVSNAVLELWNTATLTNSSSIAFTFSLNGTLDLRNFTTSSALTLSSLTLESGSLLTHGQNTSTQNHVINISATTITQNVGASIDVSGKGYAGRNYTLSGYGPGGGVNIDGIYNYGSGAGHGGRGGDDSTGDIGGSAYCSPSDPGTVGSGGGGGGNVEDRGGNGGGFIGLTSSGNLTLAGSVNANGFSGSQGSFGGGGAGGGIRLSSGSIISLNSATISVDGGNQGDYPGGNAGAGGGGCVYIIYTSSYTTVGATTSTSAGSGYSGGGTPAANGTWVVSSLNSQPSVSDFSPVVATDGSGVVSMSTVVYDDDSNTTSLFVDFSIDNGDTWTSSTMFTDSSWTGTGISTVTGTISNVTTSPSGRSLSLSWDSRQDGVTTSAEVVFRIQPYDGAAYGDAVTTSAFSVDNVDPIAPGNITAIALSTSMIRIGFAATSTDVNFLDYYIYAALGAGVNSSSTIGISSSTDANLGDINFNGATSTVFSTSTSPNTQFSFLLGVRDAFGNTNVSISSVTVYMLASVPSSVSAAVSGNNIILSWSGDATRYYAQNITAGTVSGWITGTSYQFTNLNCGTNYTFKVKGRNADEVETAYTSTVSATTAGCPSAMIIAPPSIKEPIGEREEIINNPEAEPITEETEEVENTVDIKSEPIKKTEKKSEKQEKKTDTQKTDAEQKQTNDDSLESSIFSNEQAPTVATQEVSIGDAGIKIVRQGETLKITNDILVALQLDTTYDYVTIQDESGRRQEHRAVQPEIPWQLSGGDGQKCITATFFDANNSPVKQKVTCVSLDTVAPLSPQVKNIETKVLVEGQKKEVSVHGITEPFATIILKYVKVTSIAFEFIQSAHATNNTYFSTQADERGYWEFTFPEAFETGEYEIEIVAKDEAGNVSLPIKRGLSIVEKPLSLAIKNTMAAVQGVIDNPEVERVNETYVAPAAVGIAVTNIASGAQLPQIFVYLRYLFTQPLLLLRRKKHKTWGTVYNAFTKLPVDLATVRLVHAEKGSVVRSQVTDTQGRYYMFGDPGEYRLEVDKNGFEGVISMPKEVQEDGAYVRVYHGDSVQVTDEHAEINYSIPLEPLGEEKPANVLIRTRTIQVIQHTVSLAGVITTGCSFIISPEIKIALFFFLHVLFYALSYKFTHIKLPQSFGTVRSSDGKKGLHNVVVRVFDLAYNKLVTTILTDRKGRYAALVGPSVYYIVYEKPGFEIKKSANIDCGSLKTKGLGGMIIRNEVLEEIRSSGESKDDHVQQTVSSDAYSVMPIIPSEKMVQRTEPLTDVSGAEDMSESISKNKDQHISDPDDIIAQWKKDHL